MICIKMGGSFIKVKKFFILLFSVFCFFATIGVVNSRQENTAMADQTQLEEFSMDFGAAYRLMWTVEKSGITFTARIPTAKIPSGYSSLVQLLRKISSMQYLFLSSILTIGVTALCGTSPVRAKI